MLRGWGWWTLAACRLRCRGGRSVPGGVNGRLVLWRVYVKAFNRLYNSVSRHVDARMDATNGCSTPALGPGAAQRREGSAQGEGWGGEDRHTPRDI
jgi:hypothetical protein